MTTIPPQSLTSPGLVLLATKVASGSAQIDFTQFINSAYDEYEIHFFGVTGSVSAANFRYRTSSDGGSTFDSGAANYRWAANMNDGAAGADIDIATSDDKCEILGALGCVNAAPNSMQGVIKLINPAGTTFSKLFQVDAVFWESAGNIRRNSGFGARLSTAIVNAIRFYMGVGNIATGTFRLYGVKK